MSNFVSFFEDLKATASTNKKKELVAGCDTLCRKLLVAALDPDVNYYVTSKTVSIETSQKSSSPNVGEDFLKVCQALAKREITGARAIKYVEHFFSANCDARTVQVLSRILFRESIGVDAKVVNAAIPDLIPEFRLMLAPNKIPNLKTEVEYPVMVQPKLDGIRCIVRLHQDGTIDITTRNGKKVRSEAVLSTLKSDLLVIKEKLAPGGSLVLDGELYVHGWSFARISSAVSTETGNEDSSKLEFHVWDQMSGDHWDAKDCPHGGLKRFFEMLDMETKTVKIVKTLMVSNEAEAKTAYETFLSEGYEGAMLKSVEGKYVWKRATIKSGEVAKLKVFITEDLTVTGVEVGEGRNSDRLGKLLVEYKGNTVGVGSGFTDAQREEIWANRESVIGRVAEVKYFEETITDGLFSLRFPVFVRWRDDK